MNKKLKHLSLGLMAVGVLGAGGYGLYTVGMKQGMDMAMPAAGAVAPANPAGSGEAVPQTIAQGEEATRRHIASGIKAGDTDPVTGKKIIYYHDPMAVSYTHLTLPTNREV